MAKHLMYLQHYNNLCETILMWVRNGERLVIVNRFEIKFSFFSHIYLI